MNLGRYIFLFYIYFIIAFLIIIVTSHSNLLHIFFYIITFSNVFIYKNISYFVILGGIFRFIGDVSSIVFR